MKIPIMVSPPLDPARASFQTHLNYIKRLEHLLSKNTLTVSPRKSGFVRHDREINRFRKLDDVTHKSVKKDIELAREDPAFAVIAAPWFPVKCYYSLYYLESILSHLIDGSSSGFGKGGHAATRRKVSTLIAERQIIFSATDLNRIYTLTEINLLPAINGGANTRSEFWKDTSCTGSVVKKLMEYKLHDAKLGRKWNLRTKKHQTEKVAFIAVESLLCIDFFFWYRIKANYRDLDYIDFENGITEKEVLEYMEHYHSAFRLYRNQLAEQINRLAIASPSK